MENRIIEVTTADSATRDDNHCGATHINIGRFGVWRPEDSVVTNQLGSLFLLPKLEELESLYVLPKRRQRERDDGVGGAVLFSDAEAPSSDLEATGFSNGNLGECSSILLARRQWNDVLVGRRKGLKRRLVRHSTGPRKMVHVQAGTALLDAGMGDDAVRFFAEAEQGSVNFVYCNRVDSGKDFLPYDLVVVPREEIKSEYFILSSSGLIHIEPGSGVCATWAYPGFWLSFPFVSFDTVNR
eukprot:c5349_g1_i1 orf=622-1344(+)